MASTAGTAQDTRATMLGVVTDPSGGLVPGANLTAIHVDTETRYYTLSNSEGNYVIPYLLPGQYRLRVQREGFRTFELTGIELRLGDRLRLDAALQLGNVIEKVIVTSEPALLDRSSASAGSVVDSRRMAVLPVAHGNPYLLIQLSASVAFGGNATLDRPFEPSHIANYSMGGSYGLRNDITLDGTPNESMTAGRNQTAASYVPPADAVGEMRVTTAPFDATVGHTEGGVIAFRTRSGSNTPHATAYYHNQNPAMFANSWLANSRGQARPDFSYSRWGGSASGPAVIPRIYDGRRRTFFLWSYEGIHERRPRSLGIETVPTAEERVGDFSPLLATGPAYQLYDPATRRLKPGGGITSDPFPGNVIPRSRIDPIALNILRYYPLPNVPGTADGQDNFSRPDLAEGIAYHDQLFRVDHNLGERHHLFASAALYTRASDYLNYFNNLATGEEFQLLARHGGVDYVGVLSSNTVLNVRYGYNRFVRSADLNPASRGFDLTTLAPGNGAWAAWNSSVDAGLRRFPLIDIMGYYDLVGTSSSGVLMRPQDTHAAAATVNHSRGRHAVEWGAEYRVYRKGETAPYPPSAMGRAGGSATGWLLFKDDWTKGPTDTSPGPPMGGSMASFLLGLPAGGGIARQASFAEQSTVSAFFFQDRWTAGRRLNIDLGLRYELEGPLTERYNRSVRGFDPTAFLPIAAQVQANFAAIAPQVPELAQTGLQLAGGVTFAGVNGPRELYRRDPNNFMPRVGLAYSLDPKTVLRAGYGIFFGAMGIRRGDVYQTGFSRTTPLTPSSDNGLTFQATLANPFPNGALDPPGASLGAMTNIGDSIGYFNTAYLAPYMQRWQFSVQRELPESTVLEVAYVGNRGTKLEMTRNPDGVPLQYLSTLPVRDQARIDYLTRQDLDNPFYGVLPATSPLGSSQKISRAALLTAYPQFTAMETTSNEGYSWYHSLLVSLEKRFGRGYTFGASYTRSKFMDAISCLNYMDPGPYRTISSADRPHRLSASWIWELPLGRKRALAGWQVEGLYVYQSGAPLEFGNIIFNGDIHNVSLPSNQRKTEQWFNTDAGFLRDGSKSLAMNVRTFPMRFSGIRGPGMNNWDISALKNTKVNEKLAVQFRAEFLNAVNHAWFGNPNTIPTSAAFGTITSEQGNMRRVQFGVRLMY